MHARTAILALLTSCLWLLADSANLRVVREIWVPEGWSPPEVGDSGRGLSYKPSVPSDFRKRDIGAIIHLGSVSVTRNRHRKGVEKKYTLRVGDKEYAVAPGGSVRLSGKRYRVVGEQDGILVLQDRKTKALIRFRKEAVAPPETEEESSSSADGER